MSDPADDLRGLPPEKRQLLELLLQRAAGGAPLAPDGLSQDLRELYELLVAQDADAPAAPSAAFVPPSTPMEQKIAQIWREVLHVEQIGVHDNFFDLGGHSLLLYQVVDRLQQEHRIDLSIIKTFKYPTVFALAQHLSGGAVEAAPDQQQIKDSAQKQRDAIERQRQITQEARNNRKA